MSSTQSDPPPGSGSGESSDPPVGTGGTRSADIKPPTAADSETTGSDADPPTGGGGTGGGIKDSSGIGE